MCVSLLSSTLRIGSQGTISKSQFEDQTQIVRLGVKWFYLLSHLPHLFWVPYKEVVCDIFAVVLCSY